MYTRYWRKEPRPQSDLREKDIITRVDGQSVRNMTDLQELLACYEMGGTD